MNIFDAKNKEIKIEIPLTTPSGKLRVKKRNILNEYGVPVATRKETFNQSCYIEWQIGYDTPLDDAKKTQNTTLLNLRFIGANGKEKALYELSEFIKYFYDWKVISKQELTNIKTFLHNMKNEDFLDNSITHPELAIKRTNFIQTEINGFSFLRTQIEYPLLVYKFKNFEIITEITIREKQKAIGIQPMLYFCFPITELENSKNLLGRVANTNETSFFNITKNNIHVFVEMLKLFGTLSKNHNVDTIKIIDTILK